MLDVWKCCAVAAVTMLLGISGAYAADAPARMRICAMDVDYPPFGKVEGTGHPQYPTHQAAKSRGLELERRVAPRHRCLDEIKTGVSDAMATAWSPQRSESGAFPMAGNTIDASMATGVMTYRIYRRTGSTLNWDGKAGPYTLA